MVDVHRGTPISAGHGYAAFSSYDPTTNRYRLAVADGTTVQYPTAVPARRGVFDATIGTDRHGRAVVTYTECRTRARRPNRVSLVADFWPDQRGCQVHALDIASGRVSRLAIQKIKGESAWLPVLSGTKLAYARLRNRGVTTATRRGVRVQQQHYRFELASRTASGRTRRLVGGPNATATLPVGNDGLLIEHGGGVTSLDVQGSSVVYTWANAAPSSMCEPDPEDYITYAANLYIERHDRRTRLARGCSYRAPGINSSASFAPGGDVLWLQPSADALQVGLSSGRQPATFESLAAPTGAGPMAVAQDEAARWYVLGSEKRVWVTRLPTGT